MAKSLGIKKDLQAKAGIPIGAPKKLEKHTVQYPNGYEFPIVQLVNVYFDPKKEVTRNNIKSEEPVLGFVFVTKDGKQFTHIEFPIDEDDETKFDSKLLSLHQRIKHIFEESVGANKFVEGSMDGETFAELYENVANAFKAEVITKAQEGKEDKVIALYTTNSLYLKLTYYKDRLQIPLYPNFVQKANGAGNAPLVCELLINPTHDKIVPVAKATQSQDYSGGSNAGFPSEGGAYPSFPDVPLP